MVKTHFYNVTGDYPCFNNARHICKHSRKTDHQTVSVNCNSIWKNHHHWSTILKICIKIPPKLFGQVGLKFYSFFAQGAVDSRASDKLEKVLKSSSKTQKLLCVIIMCYNFVDYITKICDKIFII